MKLVLPNTYKKPHISFFYCFCETLKKQTSGSYRPKEYKFQPKSAEQSTQNVNQLQTPSQPQSKQSFQQGTQPAQPKILRNEVKTEPKEANLAIKTPPNTSPDGKGTPMIPTTPTSNDANSNTNITNTTHSTTISESSTLPTSAKSAMMMTKKETTKEQPSDLTKETPKEQSKEAIKEPQKQQTLKEKPTNEEDAKRKQEEEQRNKEYLKLVEERKSLREANLLAAKKKPDPATLKNLDSSIKKITSFIKKLRTITEEGKEALCQELQQLNLLVFLSMFAAFAAL